MRFGRCLTVLALPATVASQGFVSPNHFANCEGTSYGYGAVAAGTTPDRLLQVHDDLQGAARTLSSLAFRRDGTLLGPGYDYPAYNVLCDVFLSTAATTSATASSTFDANHGSNKTQVAAFRLAQFKATTHTTTPGPWDYKLTFAQPWAFNGTGPLCVEVRLSSTTLAAGVYLDFQNYPADSNPYPVSLAIGTGCTATGQPGPATMSGSSGPNWPANSMTLYWQAYYLPTNSVVYLCLGSSATTWSGLPLPLELPFTATAPSGPCTVYTDWLVQIPSLTNASGSLSQNIGFPVTPFLHGLNLYSQLVVPDAMANPFGLVMSNLQQFHMVAPYASVPVTMVYASGGLPTTGTVYQNQAYPILFQ